MALATADDIATRLGRALTAAERAFAEQTIATVTGLIADAVSRDVAWADALDPVPPSLKGLCVEKVIAVGSNPQGLRAESESLGEHEHSRTFATGGAGSATVFLTREEIRTVRRALKLGTFQSVTLATPYSGDDHEALPDLPL
jgi:hypothetical protein